MAYLRIRPHKITKYERYIIHAIRIVLHGTTSMLLNEIVFFFDLIEGE